MKSYKVTRGEKIQMDRIQAIMSNDYNLPEDENQKLKDMITNPYGILVYIALACYHSGFGGKPELIAQINKKSLSQDEYNCYSSVDQDTILIVIVKDEDNDTYNIKGTNKNMAIAIHCNQGLVKPNNKVTTYRLALSNVLDDNTPRRVKLIPEKAIKPLGINYKHNNGKSANRGYTPDNVINSVNDIVKGGSTLDAFF